MRLRILLILCITVFFSCTNVKEEVQYDSEGNFMSLVKSKDKRILLRVTVIDEELSVDLNEKFVKFNDTIVLKHKNGNVFLKIVPLERYYVYYEYYTKTGEKETTGFIRNNRKVGTCSYFKENKLYKTEVYVQVKDSVYLTEIIYYNKNGSIDEHKSDYLDWQIPDTLMIGKSVGTVNYKNKWKDCFQNHFCIGYGITSNFNNLLEVKIDTFIYPTIDRKFKPFFKLEFNQLGKQKIRGFIYEAYYEEEENSNEARIESANRYFEKEFYIIPRPDSISKSKVIDYTNFDINSFGYSVINNYSV